MYYICYVRTYVRISRIRTAGWSEHCRKRSILRRQGSLRVYLSLHITRLSLHAIGGSTQARSNSGAGSDTGVRCVQWPGMFVAASRCAVLSGGLMTEALIVTLSLWPAGSDTHIAIGHGAPSSPPACPHLLGLAVVPCGRGIGCCDTPAWTTRLRLVRIFLAVRRLAFSTLFFPLLHP